jgi:transglutaminase-like putative cysteine protease
MFFEIHHTTRYTYPAPVALDPHVFRLRPRSDGTQNLLEYQFHLEPNPVGISHLVDVDGHAAVEAWFAGTTDHLTITSRSVVRTFRDNPFDFLYTDPATLVLPMQYPESLRIPLLPYLRRPQVADSVVTWAHTVATEANHRTDQFTLLLTQRIAEMIRHVVRLTGPPMDPAKLLSVREGACRDTAVLFVTACRLMGIASRFVSGYTPPSPTADSAMHAWAEVFIPGAGWRGYDPSVGLAVTNQHVAVAAAADPSQASPVTGSFRSASSKSDMTVTVDVQVHPFQPEPMFD